MKETYGVCIIKRKRKNKLALRPEWRDDLIQMLWLALVVITMALYVNGYFHWVDSDGQQCSLLPKHVNNLRTVEGLYHD